MEELKTEFRYEARSKGSSVATERVRLCVLPKMLQSLLLPLFWLILVDRRRADMYMCGRSTQRTRERETKLHSVAVAWTARDGEERRDEAPQDPDRDVYVGKAKLRHVEVVYNGDEDSYEN